MDYSNISKEELERLVNNKDGDAICELAERCLYGTGGLDVNYTRAYQLFHKGEKMGLSRAYIGLGEMYRNGMRFIKNEDIAREYYQKAGVPYPGANTDNYATFQENNRGNQETQNSTATQNKSNGLAYADIKAKLDAADQARKSENYNNACMLCNEVIRMVENIGSGMVNYSGNEDVEDFLIEANWILAYTAFNQQNYSEMENYLAVDGVQGLHPWGTYLLAVSHKMMQSPPIIMEQDLQMLIMVSGNQNLSLSERGDVCTMIGDLVTEGYGSNAGVTLDMAKSYYEEGMNCGNEYARSRFNELG